MQYLLSFGFHTRGLHRPLRRRQVPQNQHQSAKIIFNALEGIQFLPLIIEKLILVYAP